MRKICSTLSLYFFMLLFISSIKASSFGILGNVDKYLISISTLKDGTLNMEYNITLTVGEKNVEKIDIKLPQGVYTLKSFDNKYISSINFGYRNAHIVLNREYKKGEKIILNFKCNLSNAYRYSKRNQVIVYRLGIGNVKDFVNNEIVVKWNKSGVFFQGRGKEQGNYYVWKQEYSFFRNFEVMIQYKVDKFRLTSLPKTNNLENYIYNYGLIVIAFIVIFFEIKTNIINYSYSKFPFRGKNVI